MDFSWFVNNPVPATALGFHLFFLLWFVNSFYFNRYRLRSGVLFFLCVLSLAMFLFLSDPTPDQIITTVLFLLSVLLVLLVIFGGILLVVSMLYNGVVLLRKEGFSVQNCLSLILVIHLILTPVIITNYDKILHHEAIEILVGINGILTIYLLLMAIFYVTSGILVIVTSQHRAVDYIIVLGCGLKMGKEVTPLLAGRVDQAIRLYRKAPQRSYLVMSGGQGADEQVSEAAAMKTYALSKGIEESHILLEEQSVNTEENMAFSRKLIESHCTGKCKISYATNRYHQFRAGAYAHDAGMNIRGVGSRTKTYFEQNAIIREFLAMVHRDQKMHMIFLSILVMLYLFMLYSNVL